jgi:hypothetical protein
MNRLLPVFLLQTFSSRMISFGRGRRRFAGGREGRTVRTPKWYMMCFAHPRRGRVAERN